MRKEKIIRVGVMNNFNCTKAEYSQLANWTGKIFVNTNIRTITSITAKNINSSEKPIVITINPDIVLRPEYLLKLKLIKKSKIGFIRLKYVPGHNHSALYSELVNQGYNVVVTLMRFKRKLTRDKFVLPAFQSMYEYKRPYLHLKKEYWPQEFINICNRKGKGCTSCYLCSKLTFKVVKDCYSLNLSKSGNCRYDCPDCFAKACLAQSGNGRPRYNVVKQNSKQKGE